MPLAGHPDGKESSPTRNVARSPDDVRVHVQPVAVAIAAWHADPRTTMRYDRARTNLDRHANYVIAAYMSSGT